MEITKNMMLMELFKSKKGNAHASVLGSYGMHCLGCAMSRGETIEQAANAHGIDVDELIKILQAVENA